MLGGDPAAYVSLREKEGRICSDDLLKTLPEVPPGHPHAAEWALRAKSLGRFLDYLARHPSPPQKILDLGCGNGWFSRHLAETTPAKILALDNNLPELEQAARVFPSPNIIWACGDVFAAPLLSGTFDMVTVVAALQYFPDAKALLNRLFECLRPGGEVHLLDSPVYADASEAAAAATRSRQYYAEMSFPQMAEHYFHHTYADFSSFSFEKKYDPTSWRQKLASRFGQKDIPFPWLRFVKPA